ncbi:MAG: DUF4276 family protein [Saprospiraceae bacterium]
MNKPILNIALIGEGKNDVGIMGEKSWQDGTVQAYVDRFLGDDFELKFEVLRVSKKDIKQLKIGNKGRYRKQKIRGIAKKILRFVQLYPKRKFDLLILFSDVDKTQGKEASENEAKAKYASILADLENGKQFLFEKKPEIKFVPMIPVRILECWLLGDKDGFENIACSPQNPKLPNQPEQTWGEKNNPESDYPKHYLKRILENNDFPNNTETYRNIVFNNNFQNLNQNCSISFPLFYNKMMEVKEIFQENN